MINRKNLVARHRIRLTQPDAGSPLSVGNGEFAFTADITGLQTFPAFHQQHMQLGTQAQWGWHAMPNPAGYQQRRVGDQRARNGGALHLPAR